MWVFFAALHAHGVDGVMEKALHDGDLKISPALLACCAFAFSAHGRKKARSMAGCGFVVKSGSRPRQSSASSYQSESVRR
jgi:hypothetical protein